MGDKRLTARLVKSAALLAAYPARAINANVESDEAAVNRDGLPLGVLRLGFDEAGKHKAADSTRKTLRWPDGFEDTRPACAKRLARCEQRFRKVTLPAIAKGAEPVPVSAVHLVERNPPGDEDPIRRFLLTAVDAAATAAEMIGYCLQRWRVENFFRVLESGCRAGFLMFRTGGRLQRAIAINAVIAWRIMAMTLPGRQVPACEAELLFTDHELNFLRRCALNSRLEAPDAFGSAVRLVAHPGRCRGRTPDPGPGNRIMRQGCGALTKAAISRGIGHEFGFGDGKRYMLEQVQEDVG